MALSLGSANGDKDVMANLAARLMGKAKTAAAPKPPAAAAPRSMPAPQFQSSSTASSVTSSSKHVPTSSVGSENIPPKQTLASTFVKGSEDVNMTDIDFGPSLFGSADQLAEARQFASSATAGGHKSRPASRRRLASKEPERPPSSNSSSSTRTRFATTAPNPVWSAFSVGPTTFQSPPVRAETPPTATVATASQGQKPITLTPAVAPTPAPTPVTSPSQRTAPVMTEQANSSNTIPSPTKAKDNTIKGSMKEAFERGLSHAHPTVATPVKKDEGKSLQAKQLADITNTFKERAGNATPPPHLRSRAAAAGIPERKDTAPIAVTPTDKTGEAAVNQEKLGNFTFETPKKATTAVAAVADKTTTDKPNGETEAKTNGVHEDPVSTKTVQVEPINQKSLLVHAANVEKVLQGTQAPKVKTEPDSPEKTAALNGVPAVNGAAEVNSTPEKLAKDSKADTNAEIFRMLESVEKTVTTINSRIQRLEADNFEMQKQLVGLVEERERRQFLGTDSGKMPFGMEVNAPNGKTYKVQVSAELKVYELIRRIRTKAELAPMESTNPRVMVDGKVVGHGMMLGELGISNENKRKVEFSYD